MKGTGFIVWKRDDNLFLTNLVPTSSIRNPLWMRQFVSIPYLFTAFSYKWYFVENKIREYQLCYSIGTIQVGFDQSIHVHWRNEIISPPHKPLFPSIELERWPLSCQECAPREKLIEGNIIKDGDDAADCGASFDFYRQIKNSNFKRILLRAFNLSRFTGWFVIFTY